jgi:hypothetical protein
MTLGEIEEEIDEDSSYESDESDEFDVINRDILDPMYSIMMLLELQYSKNSEFYKLIAMTYYKIDLYYYKLITNSEIKNETNLDKIIRITKDTISKYHKCASNCYISIRNFEEYDILFNILKFSVEEFEKIKNK